MIEYDKILFNFDKLSNYMLVLADICEENGDIWKAKAWRWLYKNKRKPKCTENGYYLWMFSPPTFLKTYKCRLPDNWRKDVWIPDAEYCLLSDAYEEAAKYIELFLKEKDEN